MGLFFIYILKASVCLALFYLFYKVLLSKETFHRFNRLALLGILVLSCLLPAVKIAISEPTALNQTVSDLESLLMLAELNAGTEAAETVSRFGWQEAMVSIYLTGAFCCCIKSLIGIGRICTVIRRNRKERLADGSILVRYPGKIAPFSWMHYIVMPDTDLQEDNRAIVEHEQAHIRLRHSWDLLLAQACIVVQWFNPAAWLVKQELQNIHEYEADEAVLASGVNAKEYQLLLIKKAVGSRLYSLANSLNHSSLKKRITMMMRKKSNPWARAKYLYVLPLAAVAVAAFARPEISKPLEEISRVKVTEFPAISDAVTSESIEKNDTLKDNEEEPYTAVEQMPQFPGGPSELMKYISANLRYPEDAKRDKTEGRVIARFTVKEDGSIGDVNIVRGVSPSLDAEAVRVLSGMPKWEPGMQNGKAVPTLYTVPVVFRIIEDGKQDSTEVALAPKPLVLVDGKEYTGSLDAIDPQSIERIDVLKGKHSKKYTLHALWFDCNFAPA
ncbi:M56 family metallopeptidase [Phocaeicola salanitronis]|uniref:M56 family metallopeptidase n=1 Tax=Phocaeicola salanitronis TaxID=376805 RepID=UPI0023F6E671|nr:M56 family metallopeptidase [Phocaeicola salanitronis]